MLLADEAERWIGSQPADEPWFLQLSFVQPHVPLIGDPIWADHYAGAHIERSARAVPASSTDDWDTHLGFLRKHSHSELLTDEFVLAGARQYYAMVSLIDQRIGGLITQLESLGQLDNTWIVYSSDHGEMLGDHGLMAKMNFYRSSVRVPLIIRPAGGPGEHPGRIERSPVQAFDVAATLLDAGRASPLDGAPARSLVPFVTGSDHTTRDHAASMIRMRPGMPTWQAVTDERWRATFDADSEQASELFDLATDPDEAKNLATETKSGEVLDRLATALTATIRP